MDNLDKAFDKLYKTVEKCCKEEENALKALDMALGRIIRENERAARALNKFNQRFL